MRSAIIKTTLLSLLAAAVLPASAFDTEKALAFKDLPYPIELALPAGKGAGAVLFESAFSEIPSLDYDTLLLQGEMPDPGINIEIAVQSSQPSGRYQQTGFRRFPNGRFWARYRVAKVSRLPLKLIITDQGLKTASKLILYGSELDKASSFREVAESTAAALPYVPDPSYFLPAGAPFKVVRRADWKAAPPKEAYTPHAPKYFTLHHTQGHYPKNYAEAVAEIQFVQDFHQNGRGWNDIAYHFMIDPQGDIFEGRPIGVLGSHVKNHNTANIGISIMGNYHPPVSNAIAQPALDSFVAVGRYLRTTYEVNVSSFYAHRDLGDTDCPGDDLYAKKTSLRDLIFTPQPLIPAGVPPLTPAQRSALNLLLNSIEASPQ